MSTIIQAWLNSQPDNLILVEWCDNIFITSQARIRIPIYSITGQPQGE